MRLDLQYLFRAHALELRRSLRRRGHSAETAADLTQDTFVRLLTAQTDAGVIENPKAFLFRVARNLSTDLDRRRRLLPLADNPDEALGAIADPQPSAEQALLSRQELAIVENALNQIPPTPREAFLARLVDGKTFLEIGQALDLSPQTASSYVLKVMLRLKQALDLARA